MKLDWKSVEVLETEGLDETLQACKVQLMQKENRIEHQNIHIFTSYLKADGNKIIIGYLIFLFVFIYLIFTKYFELFNISLYYCALGIYFTTLLFRHQESGLHEILYTTPLNGAKLFLFQIGCFLTLYILTIGLLITCGSFSHHEIIEVVTTSVLPLCLSEFVLLSSIVPIRSYQVALSVYVVLSVLFTYVFTGVFEKLIQYSLSSTWFSSWISYQPYLCVIAIILFLSGCICKYQRLGKEGFYEINN